MKVVTIKFKKGIKKEIKNTQKDYEYMCPVNDINVGDYVLVEVKIHDREDFQVARIESVIDIKNYISKDGTHPYGFVICKLHVKDFEHRLDSVRKLKHKVMCRNGQILAKKRKMEKEMKKRNSTKKNVKNVK